VNDENKTIKFLNNPFLIFPPWKKSSDKNKMYKSKYIVKRKRIFPNKSSRTILKARFKFRKETVPVNRKNVRENINAHDSLSILH